MNQREEMYGGETGSFLVSLGCRTGNAELNGEYVLPDYQPEIRRVLRVGCKTLQPTKYVGGNELELNGTVDYTLLYIGADGGLYTAPLTAEYDMRVPLEETEWETDAGVCTIADMRTESVTVRVTAPRRLSIRCRVCADVHVFGRVRQGEHVWEDMELLRESVNACAVVCGMGELPAMHEEIALESDTVRVIGADADTVVEEIVPTQDTVRCRGYVSLCLLVCEETNPSAARSIRRRVSFDTDVAVEGIDTAFACRADGWVTDLTLTVEEARVGCDLTGLLRVCGQQNRPVEYTRDLYSVKEQTEVTLRHWQLPYAVACANGNFSQNEKLSVEELGIPEDASVIEVYPQGSVQGCEREGSRLIWSGSCRYTVLWCKNEEYATTEFSLPFRYECLCEQEDVQEYACTASVLSWRLRSDGGVWNLEAEIGVCLQAWGRVSCTCVSDVSMGEVLMHRKGEVTVCFPAAQERIWDVAKRYAVPTSALSEFGEPSALSPKFLLIPEGA